MSGFDLFTPPKREKPDTPLEPRPALPDPDPFEAGADEADAWLSNPLLNPAVAECSTGVADGAAAPEPAENCAKLPPLRPTVASVATVAGMRQGIAFMLVLKKPRGVKVRRYAALLKDLRAFDRKWLDQAVEMGWTAKELFGCWRNPLAGRLDHDGLLHLLAGREIVELHPDRAMIRADRLGHLMTYTRAFDHSASTLLWDAYAALPQVEFAEPE